MGCPIEPGCGTAAAAARSGVRISRGSEIFPSLQDAMESEQLAQSMCEVLRRIFPPPALRFFSVCSGIEAASVAWKPIGWRAVGLAEIEKFPSAVLARHYAAVPNHGDFTKIDAKSLGRVDILCGGTPCQAFSIAGARRSLDDARGNLTLAFVGLAHELADGNGLRNVVWENVPGVLSTKDNAFGCFLAGLVGADEPLIPVEPKPAATRSSRRYGWSAKSRAHYIKWPRAGLVTGPKGRAAWTIKDAQYFGLAQRRERVLVVADFGNGADPAAVLFEPESVRRDSPPSREAGQGTSAAVAPSLVSSGRGVARTGDTRGQDPVVACFAIQAGALRENPDSGPDGVGVQSDLSYTLEARAEVQAVSYVPTLARCDATREGQSQDFESTTMLAVSVTDRSSHALKAEGADASEDGTGRGVPVIAFNWNAQVDSLPTTARDTSINDGLTCSQGAAVAIDLRNGKIDGDITQTLQSHHKSSSLNAEPTLLVNSAVRRLTPRECERLQGFQWQCSPSLPGAWQDASGRWWSPDYTAIPWRGKPPGECPDGPRYKALGNSWAVPKFRWLGERIARLMPR
jgi:DNA (cytosine-5)-methyltransferase 1